ncbi:MAG: AI-2E family transporter [Bacteroidetes bacterium]|jgi:predicted PurR-regulated permease PerM|nr:AI-2E family transporter [Bacteroidota bacterium]MBK6820609.1 AI-2E family transporter [Bacteroidota bacterium]HMT34267.1 AI-2E family transporter [Chitinophagaceae bacterium]
MQINIHPNRIRQILFLSLILLLGIVIFKELYFMLSALLGAITLYVIMRNWMIHLVTKYKMKRWLAALSLILLSFVVLVIPIAWMGSVAFNKVKPIFQNPEIINTVFEQIHQYLIVNFNIDILNKENVAKLTNQIMPMAQKTIGGTLSTVGNLLIMYVVLYFLLVQISQVELWIRRNLPFNHQNSQFFIVEFKNLVYSNAIGIPIVAVIQGFASLIGYWIFGVDSFILMAIFTAVCSVIPLVGPSIVWVPLSIYMLAQGEQWQGIGVALWGFIVIGSVDNIARFVLQKKLSDVHPLITILGVIIGISLFGFLGIIFGPLLISMFILLVNIYNDEFGKSNESTTNLEVELTPTENSQEEST